MADIDVQAIREAIARRQGGGSATPVVNQMSAPAGALPSGAPNTPTPAPPPVQLPPNVPQAPVAPQGAVSGKKPPLSQVANFDDETKGLVKGLISKLMSTL
jgi:hypothetical protein